MKAHTLDNCSYDVDGVGIPNFPLLFTKAERIMLGLLHTVQSQKLMHRIAAFHLCDRKGRAYRLPGPYGVTGHTLVDYPRNFPRDFFWAEDANYVLMMLVSPSNFMPKDITPFLELINSVTPDVSSVMDSNRQD